MMSRETKRFAVFIGGCIGVACVFIVNHLPIDPFVQAGAKVLISIVAFVVLVTVIPKLDL